MITVNHIRIIRNNYHGGDYFRITAPEFGLESQWETKSIMEGTIRAWKADKLLGSFAIGYILSESATIEWVY